ncbi:FapA family protein [Paenibacillus sp. N1-5-1-14]|uniref:DUF342 domain-containing protein n=1 Tax=Paenibacillus radicibacter TaxID=2972488 RepID=UPI0021591F0E|nr:FapA family protein [Paenibacillus radicibacter]MCR8642165.1 FapA family protein [Paenibacillus radicibacter]
MSQNLSLDFYVQISMSEDKLTAYLQFSNVPDTFHVTVDQLQECLRSNQVTHGIDMNQLGVIASDPKPFLYAKTIVARGSKSIDGRNGSIKLLHDLGNSNKKPQELEDGTVDYKELITISNVRSGQIIGQRYLPTEGTPGRSVTGEIIKSKAGKNVRFKLGKNVVLDNEEMTLYASISGMVTRSDRDRINVFPVYEVNGDVDYNVGNIDFIGTVVIRGNVLPGFKIKASGDIRITGSVEAAELDAEGSIDISGGVLGQSKARVKALGNVKSSFIQDAYIEAGGNITASQSIMHSTILAGNSVLCSGAKGLIVGGTIQAGEIVTCRTMGNMMSTTTVVEVGVLPEQRNELVRLKAQLKVAMDNLDKTNKALAMLDQMAMVGQLSADKMALRIKLSNTKKQVFTEQHEMKDRILELEKVLEDSENAKVHVIGNIYGGVKIVIGRYIKYLKDPIARVTFTLSDGDISLIPYV